MRTFAVISVAILAFGTTAIYAQEEELRHSEIAVQGVGAFTSGVQGRGLDQNATNTGGVLASYRYLFTQHQAIEVNYGHDQFTQQYQTIGFSYRTNIHTDLDEFTASYVLRFPMKRVVPFVSAGTGAVLFTPSHLLVLNTQKPNQEALATFVYGGGVDIKCTNWLVFRLGYRGLVYSAPNMGIPALDVRSITHLAEPAGGFAITF